jgi:hypothetical protein
MTVTDRVEETLRPRPDRATLAALEAAAIELAEAALTRASREAGSTGRPLRSGRDEPGVTVSGRIDPRRAAILKALGLPLVDVIERGVDAAGMVLIGATDAEIGAYFRACKPFASKVTGRTMCCDNGDHHHPERSIRAEDVDFDGALALLEVILNKRCDVRDKDTGKIQPCKECEGTQGVDEAKAS